MRTLLSLAAAAAILGLQPAAHATTQASASLNNLQYTLIDLDPNDGITPWIQITPPPGSFFGQDLSDSQGHYDAAHANTGNGFGNGSLSRQLGNASTTGSAVGSGSAQGLALSAGSRVESNPDHGSFGLASSRTDGAWLYEISPNTQLVWTAQYHLDLAVEMSWKNGFSEKAAATASFYLEPYYAGRTRSPSDITQAADGMSFGGIEEYPRRGVNWQRDGELKVQVLNASGTDSMKGALDIYASSFTQVMARPVPEPQTLALMLGGLLALGAARRHAGRQGRAG